MIITFCGHSDFTENRNYKQKVMAFLEEMVADNMVEFYLGGYGAFDSFAYACAKEYKSTHKNAKLVFVTPYITPEYQKSQLQYKKDLYDFILYPEIEKAPLKFAISYRNKFMAESADFVIAYIKREYGGAYQTYKHALKKGKNIYNIAE